MHNAGGLEDDTLLMTEVLDDVLGIVGVSVL